MSSTLTNSTNVPKGNILIVDDTPVNLLVLSTMLTEQDYKVCSAANGVTALTAARAAPPDLILLDIIMPEMDGYEVCKNLKADSNAQVRDIPVIFISSLSEVEDKVSAFAVGGVDYITKPFQVEEVNARVATHLRLRRQEIELEKYNRHLEDLVQAKVKEIADSQMATIFSLAKLAESRDLGTGKHLERVQIFCRLLATRLSGQPKYAACIDSAYVENIFHASPLHDIGKVAIPDSILLKPARLLPEEFEVMKTHTRLGAQTLEAIRQEYPKNAFISVGIEIAQSHHEKWDGGGYPDGLVGEDIPLAARIMAVADVYDALRSKRPYKPTFTHEESRDIILEGSGAHFDPDVVEAFRQLHEQFREIRDKAE